MPITGRVVVQSTIALLAVGLLTLLCIVATTTWLGERAQVYFDEVIAARNTRSAAVELRNGMLAAESSQRGFLTSGNEIYLAPFDSAKTDTLRHLEILKQTLTADRESEPTLLRLTLLINGKIAEMDETVSLKTAGKDEAAIGLFLTNRGKALMDEANVFLSGIIQTADARLTEGVIEQRANALMLRWVSIIGGLVIVGVVGGVIITVYRYTREIAQARDEVRSLNTSLEMRVEQRTADLARARDRAETLLSEVNHRVANSLALVSALVKMQSNGVSDRAAKDALAETQARIMAVADVHKRLYSSGDVRVVALDEYLTSLLDQLGASLRDQGHGAELRYELEPVKLPTDASINLGVVVTEWVTNAFKYAYPDRRGEVRVRLKQLADQKVELAVEDDGVGRVNGAAAKGTGIGTRIVKAMATTMGGEIQYLGREPGTLARLIFPFKPLPASA